jgi:lipopolysaccharide/colanic/teichoic acid biosynthesis glycosyltransferase
VRVTRSKPKRLQALLLKDVRDIPAHSVPMMGAVRMVKRLLDFGVSSVLLILFSPVIAICAFLIKCQDGGPALYRRRVVGPKGEFDAFKLRSMCENADEVLCRNPSLLREFEINFKLKDDPRTTPVGAILRKTSMDELPQLWNVLKGEMSLVGPRMITPSELEKYGPAGWIFRCVKPGLTGYWQIQGRQEVSYDKRVELDLFYVKNWSLGLDLMILAKTPLRVLRGTGAY